MNLFDRGADKLIEQDLPQVFVTVVDTDGVELPVIDWGTVVQYTGFPQLVTHVENVVIIAVRDIDAELDAVKLVSEHAAICGVQIVHVVGVTDYVYSAKADQCFWGCPVVVFEDWIHQADEAAREAELARRASADRDEVRMIDNARADGSFKKVEVTKVPLADDVPEEEEAPVF